MERRNFLKVAGATGAMIAVSPSTITGELRASDGALFRAYERVQLTDAEGNPLKTSALKKEENYVFNYPLVATPAILLDLPEATQKDVELLSEDGEKYIWKGGTGSKGTIVAYVAICAHQMAHPTPDDSFIQYCKKGESGVFADKAGIICSSHMAFYDTGSGCKRAEGSPATEPLAAIVLEIAQDDTIWAVGVLGPERFKSYLKVFKPEMKKYYGGKRKAKKQTTGTATTLALKDYTKEIIIY
ncbi:MAG: twin-arginine translocation signal domain-containing protein [Sulfurimonas sp.]|nr:twin-arginine translocation signal domain-containing protein [Sulfurimonas sp.]MDQ7060144.1 twin-arginine translocation signal domain-containing protein [Sulfurimonas sp.]